MTWDRMGYASPGYTHTHGEMYVRESRVGLGNYLPKDKDEDRTIAAYKLAASAEPTSDASL